MKRIRVLIIEDEDLALKRVERLLRPQEDFIITASAANGRDALAFLSANDVDLVLLDIEMPDMNGFEVLNSITDEKRPLVVFITAYHEYALKAFDHFAIDYLLKPFSNMRFMKMLDRIRLLLDDKQYKNTLWTGIHSLSHDQDADRNYIPVKTGKKYHLLPVAEIAYISADGNYCEINMIHGAKHVHRDTIAHLFSILPSDKFIRVHNSHIASIFFIKNVSRISFGEMEIEMKNGITLKVSRKYKNSVKALFEK